MIAVFATMTAHPGRRDELMAELGTLTDAAASEAGTLVYAVHTSERAPDVVRFYEVYADKDALRAHSSSQAMRDLLGRLDGLLAQAAEIVRCDIASAKGLPTTWPGSAEPTSS